MNGEVVPVYVSLDMSWTSIPECVNEKTQDLMEYPRFVKPWETLITLHSLELGGIIKLLVTMYWLEM